MLLFRYQLMGNNINSETVCFAMNFTLHLYHGMGDVWNSFFKNYDLCIDFVHLIRRFQKSMNWMDDFRGRCNCVVTSNHRTVCTDAEIMFVMKHYLHEICDYHYLHVQQTMTFYVKFNDADSMTCFILHCIVASVTMRATSMEAVLLIHFSSNDH